MKITVMKIHCQSLSPVTTPAHLQMAAITAKITSVFCALHGLQSSLNI